MSLYAEYIKERLNRGTVEDEKGFATFEISGDYCYIVDIYVHKEYREQGLASAYANKIADEARKLGCKYLLGTVMPNSKGSTDSIKVLLAYGFELSHMDSSLIWFKKEL